MKRKISYLLLLLSTIFWGISFVVSKESISVFSHWAFLGYRFTLGALILLVFFPGLLKALKPAVWRQGGLIGLVMFVGISTQTIGLSSTTAPQAAFIAGSSLIFLPLVRLLFDRTPINSGVIVSGLVAFTGLGILTLSPQTGLQSGDLWVLLSALAFAYQILLVGRAAEAGQPMVMAFVSLLICGLLSLSIQVMLHHSMPVPQQPEIWQAIAYTGLLATGFTYAVQNTAQQYVDGQKVAMIFVLEPLFTTLAAAMFLKEPLTLRLLIGGLLMMGALVLAEYWPQIQSRIQAILFRQIEA